MRSDSTRLALRSGEETEKAPAEELPVSPEADEDVILLPARRTTRRLPPLDVVNDSFSPAILALTAKRTLLSDMQWKMKMNRPWMGRGKGLERFSGSHKRQPRRAGQSVTLFRP